MAIGSIPLGEADSFEALRAHFADKIVGRAASAMPGIDQPIAFLSCGSNASPRRFAEKLVRSGHAGAIGVRVSTSRYTPVYAPTVSYYGSIPATFDAGSATAFPFLIIVDERTFDTIVESETRTGNYDVYRAASTAGINLAMPVYAFVSRYGSLRLGGKAIPLSEFQPDVARGMTQRQIVATVLRELGRDVDLAAYAIAVRDLGFRETLRAEIVARFGTTGGLEGFDRIG